MIERAAGDDESYILTNHSDGPLIEISVRGSNAVGKTKYNSSPWQRYGFLGRGRSAEFSLGDPNLVTDEDELVLEWTCTWYDGQGYQWKKTYIDIDQIVQRQARPVMLDGPVGNSPLGMPSRWQKVRNFLAPYDYWAPDTLDSSTSREAYRRQLL